MRVAGFKEGTFLVYTCPVAQHTLDKGTLLTGCELSFWESIYFSR